MDAAKMNQAIRMAKLYYELHYNQLEIAAREGISKSSVSRILKNAMDMGIIDWEERMTAAGATVLNGEGLICQETPDDDAIKQCEELGEQLAQNA